MKWLTADEYRDAQGAPPLRMGRQTTLAQPLPPEERWRRHLEAIPRHVANSMTMEGKPVDEAWIRERLARHLAARSPSQHPLGILSHRELAPLLAEGVLRPSFSLLIEPVRQRPFTACCNAQAPSIMSACLRSWNGEETRRTVDVHQRCSVRSPERDALGWLKTTGQRLNLLALTRVSPVLPVSD